VECIIDKINKNMKNKNNNKNTEQEVEQEDSYFKSVVSRTCIEAEVM